MSDSRKTARRVLQRIAYLEAAVLALQDWQREHSQSVPYANCAACGMSFHPTDPRQTFCSKRCRTRLQMRRYRDKKKARKT